MKFKKIAIGFAIFILTVIFIIFVDKAINPKPNYPSCDYPRYNSNDINSGYYNQNDDYYYQAQESAYQSCYKSYQDNLKVYKEKGFFIITMLSVLAIIAGVMVRSVAPVSWGLVMAGLVTLLYIFIANYEEIGKPYRAIVSGVALVFLIWLAYAKLGDKEKIKEQVPTLKPPVTPPATPPSSSAPPATFPPSSTPSDKLN